MDKPEEPVLDLTPRFHWRWGEHGIYLGVCAVLGLFVFGLSFVPRQTKPIVPLVVETIHVRYIAASDEPPENADPFHDPRVIRPFVKSPNKKTQNRSM